MEATGKHDFTATSDDELSFRRGVKLKILSMEDDKNWYKAEYEGQEGYIPSNYIDYKPQSWYVTGINRLQAETMLLAQDPPGAFLQKDGAFVVRPCESTPGEFSLSVKFGDQVQHFKVLRDGAGKYFLWVVKFDSLNELVLYHRTASVSRSQTIYLQDMIRSRVIANYEFKSNDPEELELKRGDIITVVEKKDNNWWLGEITRDSVLCRGLFPKTYVSEYSE